MISVIIPTLNAAKGLAPTLAALVPAAADGLVREVIISDGGSSDQTLEIADAMGCRIIRGSRGRGQQLIAGALEARGPWLLFLHADTALSSGFEREVSAFMEQVDMSGEEKAAAFAFALDSFAWQARFLEMMVALRCVVFRLPYGDQGLLIRQSHYRRLGGYRPFPLLEDVDLVRRIGARDLKILRASALTSANRFEKDGYFRRSLRNLLLLFQYLRGRSPDAIAASYERR